MGLTVTAAQVPYASALSTNELLAHHQALTEYREELSHNLHQKSITHRPELQLIAQQPELKPSLRAPILEFLLHLAVKTRVTNGVYYQAVRIFDRYCSKRVVLREQLQLVLATCLWLSAKTYGGCNHIINNTTVPTGGRFHGPNPRARIPRLSELCILCQDNTKYDEGMFVQMERHILDTLSWDVVEPQLLDWVFNFYENNLIQFEQQNMHDKVCVINCKRFLCEAALSELKLLELHPSQLAQVVLYTMNIYCSDGMHDFESELDILEPLDREQLPYYTQLFYSTILNLPESLLQHYTKSSGVLSLYHKILKQGTKIDTMLLTPVKTSLLPTPPSSRRGSPVGTMMN